MKTDELIRAIAADATAAPASLQRYFALLLALAVTAAAIAFWILLGPRDNALQSLGEIRFVFKFIVTLALAVPAIGLVLRLIRPGVNPGLWRVAVLLSPGLLALGVALELAALPSSSWRVAMIGSNSLVCLTYVPLIGLAPLGLLLLALRRGAPAHPALAGAVAGLIAGGIAASFYASHCPDDSPLFVAVWYSLAIAILTALGAALGSRLLRW
ncbi:NrsF family protein [Ferrovibrio sp.]|uniref:NrsF family protein n=1 Tax=Ferrovibrio sp. TaxID=1917215 RepID=UPI00262DBB66|nr:NrsF family protein [Ferrovibrio sp.]